ncbi:hypothetical protein [Haloglomus litoreum]|uniref:hypothetical protein n=1 Tax=Haloglomus litoreum TaxID=3034026 RepID=UPI0023E85751|nr:hypothetical protein [Haloglomus sp. DT116]
MTSGGREEPPYEVIDYLDANGPAPGADLPTETSGRRLLGGEPLLTIRGARNGAGADFGKQVVPVYHLAEHTPTEVIDAFLDTNDHLLEHGTAKGLVRRFGGHGPDWRDAARIVLEDEYGMSTGDTGPESRGEPQTVKCPRCEEYVDDLGSHLRDVCE